MPVARIVYNPTSGREKFKTKLSNLCVKLVENGYNVEVAPTMGPKDAFNLGRIACRDKVDFLVVCGGDGTLNEVVNALAEQENRPIIGYIPTGTTNDFARALSIPLDIDKAINQLFTGTVRKIDIGKINNNYFIYVACFGLFTKSSYETPSKLKSTLGHLAYVLNGVTDIPKLTKPLNVDIHIDGEVYNHDVQILFVINSTGVAGITKILPEAKLDDGVFDVLAVPKDVIKIVPDLIGQLIAGPKKSFDFKEILHFKTNKVEIKSDGELKWNLDGEEGAIGNAVIECIYRHIEIVVPNDIESLQN